MAKQRSQRDRYLGDELWDLEGQHWPVRLGFITCQECEWIVGGGGRFVVHEPGGPLQWLDKVAAQHWWTVHLPWVHFSDQPNRPLPRKGLLWTGEIFETEGQQLLLMESGC